MRWQWQSDFFQLKQASSASLLSWPRQLQVRPSSILYNRSDSFLAFFSASNGFGNSVKTDGSAQPTRTFPEDVGGDLADGAEEFYRRNRAPEVGYFTVTPTVTGLLAW